MSAAATLDLDSSSEHEAEAPGAEAKVGPRAPGSLEAGLLAAEAAQADELQRLEQGQGVARAAEFALALVVDLRERGSNRTPRNIYEAAQQQLRGVVPVEFRALHIGDYLWLGQRAESDAPPRCLACIERKTVSDLVGRSAGAEHVPQLQRLGAAGIPWSALLLEGDEDLAHKGACAYGAPFLADGGPRDTALRRPEDILRFLARVVLLSDIFVLLAKTSQDTIAHLGAWTHVLQHSAGQLAPAACAGVPSESALAKTREESDAAHALLIEVARAAGLGGPALEAVCGRFASVTELQSHYAACADNTQRGAMLVPTILHAGGDMAFAECTEEDWRRAHVASAAVMQVALECPLGAAEPDSAAGCGRWHPVLVVEATAALLSELQRHREDGIELREMDSTRHTEAARIRLLRRFVDAAGSGDHDGWQSPATLVQICSGELVLSTLQRAMQSSPASSSGPATPATQHQQQFRSLAHCALAAAAALSGGAPAPAGASCEAEGRRKILILEGVELAARRACKRGTASPEWAVASRIVELLPALVAALAVRHRVVALPRASRERTLRLLYALGHAVREHELLTRE